MRRRTVFAALAAALMMGGRTRGQPAPRTIRIWGHPAMGRVTALWARGFRRRRPDVAVEVKLMGTGTAIPGLYSGLADIALLGRENDVTDDNGFGRVKRYAPTRLEVMAGGIDRPGHSPALAILVHRDNPLARLTLAEVDAIFGCERKRGHAAVAGWGDLGLNGAWAGQPIWLHALNFRTGAGDFFQRRVLLGSHKLRWDVLTEHDGRAHGREEAADWAGRDVAEAVRRDLYAMGLATAADVGPGVKALALVDGAAGPYQPLTAETVAAGSYPLARRVYAFVDRPPGRPVDPLVADFLDYVLSAEGQAEVMRAGGYLALPATDAAAQRAKLGTT